MKTKQILSKHLLLSILGIGLFFSSCKKEDPIEGPVTPTTTTTGGGSGNSDAIVHKRVNVPIISKATGENCSACGGWGWQAWIDLSDDFSGTAFCFGNYAGYYAKSTGFISKELRRPNSDANIFLNKFTGVTGYPNFVVNFVSHGTSTVDAKTAANSFIASSDVKISVGFKHKIVGETLTIEAEAKTWEAISGDYYMGAYVVEDGIVAYQNGNSAGNNAVHHQVFRGSVTTQTWGEQIITANADADVILSKTFTVEIPSDYNKSNLTYGVVVWKKTGGNFTFVNAATNQ